MLPAQPHPSKEALVKKTAIVVASFALVAAAAPAAVAHTISHPGHHAPAAAKIFKSKASPSKNVKIGKSVTVKGSGALKKTSYICIEVVSNGNQLDTATDTKNLTTVTSTAAGKVTCKLPVKKYSGKDGLGSKTVHCPTTAADKKAKFSCGFALADAATEGKKSVSLAKFTAKK
jgi:hypothetical protein